MPLRNPRYLHGSSARGRARGRLTLFLPICPEVLSVITKFELGSNKIINLLAHRSTLSCFAVRHRLIETSVRTMATAVAMTENAKIRYKYIIGYRVFVSKLLLSSAIEVYP